MERVANGLFLSYFHFLHDLRGLEKLRYLFVYLFFSAEGWMGKRRGRLAVVLRRLAARSDCGGGGGGGGGGDGH